VIFSWQGSPIIQYPRDIIWSIKPNLIVKTGIARAGSLIFQRNGRLGVDVE
jgi:cephalosporin hydroxylase